MNGLTPAQKNVLDFVTAYAAEHETTPTFQEISNGLGLRSKGNVHRLVHTLAARGAIALEPGKARCITIPGAAFAVRFPAELEKQLRDYAKQQHVAPETIIRESVRAYLGLVA